MLLAILNCCTEEELETTDEEDLEAEDVDRIDLTDDDRVQRREEIKSKVLAVGRMARVFDLLRYVSMSDGFVLKVIDVIVGGFQGGGRGCL